MCEMEPNVKKHIISVLTSTTFTMTINQLSKDYRNMVGEEIPYYKLGYNSMESFLKSISDTVQVKGSGPMATVLPVVSEKSKHINELVTNQKITRKEAAHRQSFPIQQRKHLLYQKPVNTNPYKQPGTQPQRQKIFYPTRKSGASYQSYPEKPVQKPVDEPVQGPEQQPVQKPVLNTSTPENHERNSGCGKTKKLLFGRIPAEVRDILSNVPLPIRENLKFLIGQHENGIWCADLPKLYRSMFAKDINYEDFGYTSLSQLCISLPSVFHYCRPSDSDFKLYDSSKPLPPSAETKFTVASYTVESKNLNEGEICALPNIEWDDVQSFLPESVYKLGNAIPREFVPPETKEGDTIKVGVGEVFDLSKFWVYLDEGNLDNIVDDLQNFYVTNASRYLMPEGLIREGVYCAKVIYGEYHRAVIVDVLPEVKNSIKVLFIDYGTMTKVPIEGICFLHEKFAELPAQAIRCRLADICPPEESTPWSHDAIVTFRNMCRDRSIDAKVVRINRKEQILEVYLIDATDPSKPFCINTRLVELGLATYPDQIIQQSRVDSAFKPLVKYIHLFPTFLELEQGYAPSTQEMDILFNCGVPIHFCYPQYFSIDRTDEKQNIMEMIECYEKTLKRGAKSIYIDMSCGETKDLDLAIADFIKDSEMNSKDAEDEGSEDISKMYKELEDLKRETAEKVQQNLALAEDIMRELDIIKCEAEEDGAGPLVCESEEIEEESSESTVNRPELTGSSKSLEDQEVSGKTKSTDSGLVRLSGVEENRRSVDEVHSIIGSKSTNPFLSDMHEESEEDGGPLVLNPNNPFLSYIIDKKGSRPSSNNGSESIVYESLVEQKWMDENKTVKIEQRWLSSDNGVESLVKSLSITNATDISQAPTATSATRRDCATQTSDNATGPPVLYQGTSMPPSLPYGGYPPPHHYGGYPPWSTASDCAPFDFYRYGPRYPAPGFSYPDNPPIQPWMMQMPWSSMKFRSQYNPGMGPAYHQQALYHPQGSYQQQ
ncbi:unnamed protein product [Acanthoscelides obtectus]|uniref:Uncharacterized protein n=2 Tax=Acanthoscelides obtectus TaxID=200917 RepID=A0A9P0PU35_ACAOB|nr:unnamed protein product [Acanthoscelides obtectus]CAK1627166.1 Tudor domain-containing protein 5 [Acanthoscelides obtectus]